MNPRPAIAHRCYPTEHGHQHPSTYGHLWLYRRHRPYHLAWSACTQVPVHNMNLTRSIVADNVVYRIETYYPPKSEALALDISTTRKVCSNDHSPWRSWSACCHGLSCGPLPVGPRTAIRPLKEIYHREDILIMLVVSAISGNFFFSWPENLLRLLMRWRWVCILVLITYLIHHFLHRNFSAVLSDVTRTIPSWLVSLGLLATTDHSEGSGWRGDAILQDLILPASFYNSESMEDSQGTFFPFCSHNISHLCI